MPAALLAKRSDDDFAYALVHGRAHRLLRSRFGAPCTQIAPWWLRTKRTTALQFNFYRVYGRQALSTARPRGALPIALPAAHGRPPPLPGVEHAKPCLVFAIES